MRRLLIAVPTALALLLAPMSATAETLDGAVAVDVASDEECPTCIFPAGVCIRSYLLARPVCVIVDP